jgi:hypothetical protein
MRPKFAVAAASLFTLTLSAQETTLYNSIPKTLPGNVISEGLEANAVSEFGDGVNLTGRSGSALHQVTIVLSSWACQNGGVYSGTCVTKPGANFNQIVTMNIYSVVNSVPPTPGALLGSLTDSFSIPYRPTATPSLCSGDVTQWYDSKDQLCHHGIATAINFNFTNQHIALPSQVIVTVSYNTTHYGPHPIGPSAPCFSTTTGCPYDSLNVSADTSAGILIGTPIDTDGVFVNYNSPGDSCSGTAMTGVLALDDGCWQGLHPEIQISGNQNGVNGKGKSSRLPN